MGRKGRDGDPSEHDQTGGAPTADQHFVRGPKLQRSASLWGPSPIAIAHRGGAAEHPENSLAAFSAAVAIGYRYLETDVHLSADGIVMVSHDPTIDRTTTGSGAIAEQTAAELTMTRLVGPDGEPSDQTMVRLDDVLSEWPAVVWNIDAKSDAVVEPLAALIATHDCVDRVCLASFSATRVRALRRRFGAGLTTALTMNETARLWATARLPRARVPLPSGVAQVPCRHRIAGREVRVVDRRFIEAAHRHRVPVHVWTVNDRQAMEDLLDLGIDGIVTDRPTVLREVLIGRGAWPGSEPDPGQSRHPASE